MGIYLNPGNTNFKRCLNSEIYVDKTKLITFTNKVINTQQRYLCVSRPRRFGKSMAADMLAAYYGFGQDSAEPFTGLQAAKAEDFKNHLNQYQVLKLDMQSFMSDTDSVEEMLSLVEKSIIKDLSRTYPEFHLYPEDTLWEILTVVYEHTRRAFVILIDEWDCVMRRYHVVEEQKRYLDFLRNLLKDRVYVALAYMTGILPIKKYGEHSTLNMFYEYSMIDSAEISDCFGFTEQEVAVLCERYQMDFQKAKEWYDGYHLVSHPEGNRREYSIYSPKSIVESMLRRKYDAYWNQTESYEALKLYIQLNLNGLRDAVVEMLAGGSVSLDTRRFQNDMSTFVSRDDVLTLLVHLGYLAYNQDEGTVSIPNQEVAQEFLSSVQMMDSMTGVAEAIQSSKKLLQALWNKDAAAVAAGIEKVHQEISILEYNDENSLSCTIGLAFYYAREYYTLVRELPTGKGYADICLLPKPKAADKPAVLFELKYNKSVEAAMAQIKEKDYPETLKAYHGNLLLCGVNYNAKTKQHECSIELWEK